MSASWQFAHHKKIKRRFDVISLVIIITQWLRTFIHVITSQKTNAKKWKKSKKKTLNHSDLYDEMIDISKIMRKITIRSVERFEIDCKNFEFERFLIHRKFVFRKCIVRFDHILFRLLIYIIHKIIFFNNVCKIDIVVIKTNFW